MSRLCLGVLILAYLPALAVLNKFGIGLGAWGHFALIVGSVCGAYGANSAVRVWKNGQRPKTAPSGEVPGVPE